VFDQLAQQQAPQFGFFFGLSFLIQISFTAKRARYTRLEGLFENSPQPALVLFGCEAGSVALRELLTNAIGIDALEFNDLTRSSIESNCEELWRLSGGFLLSLTRRLSFALGVVGMSH
jgi:hypothetical protein